jgi:hypothetical protein
MKKGYAVFIILFLLGAAIRLVALNQLDWFFGSFLHVDEVTYAAGDTPPFERPPATYLLAGLSSQVSTLRFVFMAFSLIPALALFLFRKKEWKNSLLAGALALEPTLAFSGLQILPSAPAAAFVALAVTQGKSKPLLAGWLLGCAALFRGELLLFLPVSFFFIRPLRNSTTIALGALCAVLPLMALNFASGGSFSIAGNGSLNLWLGSSWELLETPPGIEYEELVGRSSFTDSAVSAISGDFAGWLGRGAVKTAAFLSLPGPGRNIEAPELLNSTILKFLLPITLAFLALGLSGSGKNIQTALMFTGILTAFVFFPSMRHRAVFIPVFALSLLKFRWKIAVPVALCIAVFSLFLDYPGGVRPGLTLVQLAQAQLESGQPDAAIETLRKAEENGYRGADIHSIRGAAIASSGGNFIDAATEFGRALELVPDSPTAWKNMAALLWNYGHTEDAVYAAEKAVSLNPELRDELSPILSAQH